MNRGSKCTKGSTIEKQRVEFRSYVLIPKTKRSMKERTSIGFEHGVCHRGARGHGPQILLEGASNAFGPPDFRKNYVMYTQLMDLDSVLLEKKTNGMHT